MPVGVYVVDIPGSTRHGGVRHAGRRAAADDSCRTVAGSPAPGPYPRLGRHAKPGPPGAPALVVRQPPGPAPAAVEAGRAGPGPGLGGRGPRRRRRSVRGPRPARRARLGARRGRPDAGRQAAARSRGAGRRPRARAAGRALPPPPAPPREEVRGRAASCTPSARDRRAISHHYDVGNDFYELVLGPSMVYSCAYWDATRTARLEDAQRDKLDLVCRKLALKPGDAAARRRLRLGLAWPSTPPASTACSVVGVTLSAGAGRLRPQARRGGGAHRPGRDPGPGLPGRHGRAVRRDLLHRHGRTRRRRAVPASTPTTCTRLLKPGGRLLNHQIARRPRARRDRRTSVDEFIDAYVFPDGELAPIGTHRQPAGARPGSRCATSSRSASTTRSPCAAGSPTWRPTGRRRSGSPAPAGPASGGSTWPPPRSPSSATGIGVNQVLAVRTPGGGASGMPLRARESRPGRVDPDADEKGRRAPRRAAGPGPPVPRRRALLRLDRLQHVQPRGAAGRPQRGQDAHQRRPAPGRSRSGPRARPARSPGCSRPDGLADRPAEERAEADADHRAEDAR